MQISEAAGGAPAPGSEPCRFPKLEECAHFHYERVQLPQTLSVALQANMDQSLHSQHTNDDDSEWYMLQVTSGDECWLLQRNLENFKMLDEQLHQCIYDRKISQLPDLADQSPEADDIESTLSQYLDRFSAIADNSVNCGPVLNWLQMDNKGHRLLVPSEESRSINTPAVAAAYSVRRYVSQARDELNLEVGDMISVIDMASPGESMWWRGKRGFQVGFFPQHCVHIIGDKVPRNMPLPPPVVGSLALTPIKPVLRRHGKLITFFRSFILNRPSRRRLKQSGILRERVFGCDLGEHLLNSGHTIPTVLRCCAEFIEQNGIVDGIYRLSGVTSNIQKLRNAFDEDRIPNLHTEDILQDIHSVASLLKMYFRELPNPLCTYQLYQSFVNAVQGCSTAIRDSETDHGRLLKMREAVQKLPPPHYRTLEYLMRHLARVAKHGSSTGMTTRNIAIVWAPNLLRCEALEVGGVAALQGVGVQAVVTEFLICYAHLIFCDHLPNLDHPMVAAAAVPDSSLMSKKCRPNSLAISTPTKLITLEEARSKHLVNKAEECNYIEVGGGPNNLPKKYHTIIELPPGARKRGHTKRSPLGWRLFFTKNRNVTQNAIPKNRKASTPITINEKSGTESDLTDMKRKLRTVKSAESLTSGHSEPASTEDILGPLNCLNKPPGHNRSVSHDSYFDTLQSSQNNSEGSLLDLSEIQVNFDLEESEMRIFSEDESLVSSPRIQKECQRRILTRARPEEYVSATNSSNPSPKKQARVVLSPESMSRKRTRLEDQLSDIQYIDCNTPENVVSTTTALIHPFPESPVTEEKRHTADSYQPKNKSPRNSDNLDKRQSLNLESSSQKTVLMPKSLTEMDMSKKYMGMESILASPTPLSPGYKKLENSSANSTPELSPADISYRKIDSPYEPIEIRPNSTPNYENILTTISITYRSPPRSAATSPVKSTSSVYENVIINPEKVDIPTSTASLPVQGASQPKTDSLQADKEERPKSLSALDDSSKESVVKQNLSSSAICNTSEQISLGSLNDQKSFSSNQSSGSNIQYTPSHSSAQYQFIENSEHTDQSLSEVTENLTTSQTSISLPLTPTKNSISPNVSPTQMYDDNSTQDLLSQTESVETEENLRPTSINLIDFSPVEPNLNSPSRNFNNDKRKSSETESLDDNAIYQQVKYFRRSIHEVNAMLELENGVSNSESDSKNADEVNYDSLEPDTFHVYENVEGEELRDSNLFEAQETKKTDAEEAAASPANEPERVQEEKVSVKYLTSRFEEKEPQSLPVNLAANQPESTNTRVRKFYEKDGLPPCLRAKNLKNQFKTRSLDEDEFAKEFNLEQRRKSLDETVNYKTNSLPKTLNQPKVLPANDASVDTIHLTHSTENVNSGLEETADEIQKKRERIEKYKEERRKFLHDKYRSESFKEDKDVVLSKLRLHKTRDDTPVPQKLEVGDRPPRSRRKSYKEETAPTDSLEEDTSSVTSEDKPKTVEKPKEERVAKVTESLKSRAAIFEQQNNQKQGDLNKNLRGSMRDKQDVVGRIVGQEKKVDKGELLKEDFIRHRNRDDDILKQERRRHTYDSRERETEMDRLKRVSVESRSPKKEKTSPSYCIKDMKAIFESKSKS
ncbi:GTPase-activating protein CdGAPr isoform X4 [Aethina tumida]|nr:GTPase-activating protein CdGAPr isoform X4 [Aethina tumida]XP_049824861.1 GTPase-activating protein CdGAPr isoform X4 [Aethina tumida]XP_049824862.1 GTPase-activating protein CdGAPr isoform X4 [Aethina tumida]